MTQDLGGFLVGDGMSSEDIGGFLLATVIFGLVIACARGDSPRHWFRRK